MRVNIEHREIEEKAGIFKKVKVHEVEFSVQFSDEERAIIDQQNLSDALFLERPPPAHRAHQFEGLEDVFDMTVGRLVKNGGDAYQLSTPLEAKEYEHELTEALKNLKEYIEANEGIEETSKSFEL